MGRKTDVSVVNGKITEMRVDAIVSPGNTMMLMDDNEISLQVYCEAGPGLLHECWQIPFDKNGERCGVSEARLTLGHGLEAEYILHTVVPRYEKDGEVMYLAWLRSCYLSIFDLARTRGLRILALPARLSPIINDCPLQKTSKIAIEALYDFLAEHPGVFDKIIFVATDEEVEGVYRALLSTTVFPEREI